MVQSSRLDLGEDDSMPKSVLRGGNPADAPVLAGKQAQKEGCPLSFDEAGEVSFKIVGDGYELMPDDFNPSNGTVSRAVAVCSLCGGTVEAKLTRKLFQEGKSRTTDGRRCNIQAGYERQALSRGDGCRPRCLSRSRSILVKKREQLTLKWGMDAVPDELYRRKVH